MKNYYVYIMTNKYNNVFYVGVTSDLIKRAYEHRNHLAQGFSDKYNTDKLVWYEVHDDIYAAINREKRIKRWNHDWKVKLIDNMNPKWNDLFESIL